MSESEDLFRDPSLQRAQQIDAICDEFETQCIDGRRPSIESFLLRVDAPDKQPLLLELIAIEMHYRRRQGETVALAEYQGRFPGLSTSRLEETIQHSSDRKRPAPSEGVVPMHIDRDLAATQSLQESAAQGTIFVGRYKLVEPIGEGGMGSVWLAEQKEPVKRKVALKLIKAGMDSRAVLARFEAERQALAVMDHTNIAKVFDGGMTAQGRPYFVMELVKGVPLTEYCDQVQMNVSDRLKLFTQVCSAVQHAHQKGIIHRDLKPSNILVTEYDGKPVCKVIDFGLAKAIHGAHTLTDISLHTAFGAVIGTPLYMAPEQLGTSALDVDTRADLYSLGVVLYELLTGSTPIERRRLKKAAIEEIMRIVREEEPVIPSQRLSSSDTLPSVAARRHIEPVRLTKLVRGDLDWIVMKCLEKDRNRRYETANGMSLDIRRYLAGEAVLAAPPSKIYRLRKFVRKHQGPVIAATLLGISLIGGMIGTSYGFYQANKSATAERLAKDVAENRRAEAEQARMDADAQKAEAITQKTRAEAREQEAIDAVKRFGDSVSNNPELRDNLALESLRKELLREPLTFFQSLRDRLESDSSTAPESLARLAVAAIQLGSLTSEIGDKQNAIEAFRQAISVYEKLIDGNPTKADFQSNLAAGYLNLGVLLNETGQPAEALLAFEQALSLRKRLTLAYPAVTEFQSGLATTHNNLGNLFSQIGKPKESIESYDEAIAVFGRLSRDHPAVSEFRKGLASSYLNMGVLYSDIGKPNEALIAVKESVTLLEQLTHECPTVIEFKYSLASSHYNLGRLLYNSGNANEALNELERALTLREQISNEHPSSIEFQNELAHSLNAIGLLLSNNAKPGEALQALKRATAIWERLSSDHPTVKQFQSNLAHCYSNLGFLLEPAEELKALERALAIRERLARENPTVPQFQCDVAATLNNIAEMDFEAGLFVAARDRFQLAIELQKKALETNMSHPTYRAFLKGHYTGLGKVAVRLIDADLENEVRRGLRDLAMSEPGAEVIEARLKAVSAGEPPKDAIELLTLGQRAYDTFRYQMATRFFTDSIELEPTLRNDRNTQAPYNAACSAALAAADRGFDETPLSDVEKVKLRTQALHWIQGELDNWKSFLESATAEQRPLVAQTLSHWQQDADLASIRDSNNLSKLPVDEREAFEALWKQVEKVLTMAESTTSP